MQHKRRFSAFVASGDDPRPAIVEATDFAREFMNDAGLDAKAQVKTLIVVEELVSNVLRHKDPAHDVHLALSLGTGKDAIRLELDDDSIAFNASLEQEFTGPDPHEGGSVGLAIVRAWGSDMSYVRKDGRNRLVLTVK
jgi:anti-sigma regulatory factor (Ser/Thr protein kinase)